MPIPLPGTRRRSRRPPHPLAAPAAKGTAFGLVLFLFVLPATGCREEAREGDADLQIRVTVSPDPPRVGASARIDVDVAEVDWSPRNGDRVTLEASRNGVVLAVDIARGVGAGRYSTDPMHFEVTGAWILSVRVDTRDGRWSRVQLPLAVVAPEESDAVGS
ncbi:MAG: hypothetical protein ACE5GJ_00585 [Gemmatimonadota bacterium]